MIDGLSRARIAIIYWWRHGRLPDLDRPRRFTEWVQWRKLNDRSPRLARLTDKLDAKRRAAELLGDGMAVPTLFAGSRLPAEPPGPFPLVVKSNHGCNQFRVVRTAADWDAARRLVLLWVRTTYGHWLDEWHYRAARKLVLVEPFIGGPDGRLPIDYKVYVFGGRASVVQVHVGRDGTHRWSQFDTRWRPLSDEVVEVAPPANLATMLAAAERFAAEEDFLRVDFYDVEGRLWFGEACLFPGSGLDPFHPDALDHDLGARWAAALGTPGVVSLPAGDRSAGRLGSPIPRPRTAW